MGLTTEFVPTEPTRDEIDALQGPTIVEFGTGWCGHCRAAQPYIAQAFAQYPQIAHLKVEDGPGQPLGRSFGVKLWPTLVFLKEGKEVARVIRPREVGVIVEAMRKVG